MSISNKPKEYWAAEEDAESLAENCWARAENYFQRLRNTQWWRTIFRNWAYYHGLFFDPSTNHDWSAVKELGSDGGSLAVGINHFRNFLDHLFALTTQQRADFKTRARSSGHEAEIQARWGDDILEHYMRDANLENYIDEVTRPYRWLSICPMGLERRGGIRCRGTSWRKDADVQEGGFLLPPSNRI